MIASRLMRQGVALRKSSTIFAATGVALSLASAPVRADDWSSHGLDPAHARASAERSGASFRAGRWTSAITGTPAGIVSSPAVADGVVVYGTVDGLVRAQRAVDGRALWQFKTGNSVLSSPAIHNGRVFVPSLDMMLYALRLTDGSVVWKKDLGGIEFSSPTVIGDSLIVAGGFPQHKVFRIDTATGATIWETPAGVMAQFSNSAAASDGTQVVIGAMHGHIHSFDLATGAPRWTYEAGGMVNLSAPVIANGRAYVLPGGDSGQLHAIDLATGQAVAGWPVTLPAPAVDTTIASTMLSRQFAVSSVALVSGRLVFDIRFDDFMDTNNDRVPDQFLMREFVMAVGPADGQVLWQQANGRTVVASANDIPKNWLCPTPAGYQVAGAGSSSGAALLAVASSLTPTVQILDAAGGASRFSTTVAGTSRVSPVMANGRLLVATEGGTLTSYLSSTNQPPAAPSLMGAPGQLVNAASPVIRWTAAMDPEGDAVSYQVRVDHDGEILETWENQQTTGPGETSVRLARDFQAGPNVCRRGSSARDSSGAWSEWSAPQFLQATDTPSVSVGGTSAASLAAALMAALPGSVITLGAGTFHLLETLHVPAGVSLQGAGPSQTILDGKGLAAGLSLEGSADGQPTQIKGLTVTGAQVGIAVRDTKNAQIKNVIVRDTTQVGIDVSAAGSATLTFGTLVANWTAVRSFGALTVKNSIVTGNETGFVSDHADALVTKFNDVMRNGVSFQGMTRGTNDLTRDITFADYAKRDVHVLRGQASTDQGDPADDFGEEPQPNGGRVNLGAFGGTAEAELTAAPIPKAPAESSPQSGGCSIASGGTIAGWETMAAITASLLAAIVVVRRRRRRLDV